MPLHLCSTQLQKVLFLPWSILVTRWTCLILVFSTVDVQEANTTAKLWVPGQHLDARGCLSLHQPLNIYQYYSFYPWLQETNDAIVLPECHIHRILKNELRSWQLVLCVAESCSGVCRYKFCLSDTCWSIFALFPVNKAVRFAQRILGEHVSSGLSIQFETQTLGLKLVGDKIRVASQYSVFLSHTHSLSHWFVYWKPRSLFSGTPIIAGWWFFTNSISFEVPSRDFPCRIIHRGKGIRKRKRLSWRNMWE